MNYFLKYKYINLIIQKVTWAFPAVSVIIKIDFHQYLVEVMISTHFIASKNE